MTNEDQVVPAPGIDPHIVRLSSGLTMGALFANAVRSGSERIALQEGGRTVTYRDLDQRSTRLANHLAGFGVKRGDRIAIISENRCEYIETFIACAKLGVIAASQNWRLADAELRHCVELVAPKLILASRRFSERAAALADIAPTLEFGAPYEAALTAVSPAPVSDRCDGEDGLVILYTSGTTGMPKGALISQRAEIARAYIQMTDMPNTADDAFVAWAPLFHMVSTDTVFMTLIQGGKVIVTDGFDADQLARIVATETLGRLTLMPGMITAFLDAMKADGRPARGVRWVGVMADLVPREQLAEITSAVGAPYLNTFGATETGFPPASLSTIPVGVVPASLDKRQSSFCRIKLVDPDGREVPEGEPGELAIRSPALFSGYWNNEAANAEDFRGGWFHMGDVFRRNPDGTLAFVDRRKYLIKSGGENVYPAEIERVLLAQPEVADAVVVRRSDPQWGEVPIAFVVAKEKLDAQVLIERCRTEIARYKVPKEIRFVTDADLPRSTTGKIMRHELEKRLTGGTGKDG
ncbi:AMP-binding protein [Mesorhizobium sp. YIM 152430]|uniref:class I adenylate-forming enzyme family protein n=1 Tax=Mesorhizobium sp. YIM 152430 TaxID=3031761 RepID=UPI0023DC094D|nr:AMP-binding protein [Mesorhizobium sp. YIM 152430]MDF1601606.1 AMP-binding protein [Mesorhizobium sp. YIM 152430]